MREECCFTCPPTVCTAFLICSSLFIQRLILTDSPLSVTWWQALFCLASCWVALLCTKTVKIILWALYLQPTRKSYSHTTLSTVRSAWVGKGPEQNTLQHRAKCFHYTESNSNSLDLLWTYGCELLRDMTGTCLEKFYCDMDWAEVLVTWQQRLTAAEGAQLLKGGGWEVTSCTQAD